LVFGMSHKILISTFFFLWSALMLHSQTQSRSYRSPHDSLLDQAYFKLTEPISSLVNRNRDSINTSQLKYFRKSIKKWGFQFNLYHFRSHGLEVFWIYDSLLHQAEEPVLSKAHRERHPCGLIVAISSDTLISRIGVRLGMRSKEIMGTFGRPDERTKLPSNCERCEYRFDTGWTVNRFEFSFKNDRLQNVRLQSGRGALGLFRH
jgi:hypothetical protein